MNIENSQNTVAASMNAEGNIIVGNGNVIVNLKEAAEYKALQIKQEKLNTRSIKVRENINRYPEDDDFNAELYQISREQNDVEENIQTLKKEVIKLAEEFSRISINTKRLRLARHHFELGEFAQARAVLDAEVMSTELNDLKNKEKILLQETLENQELLNNNANEFMILARLTAIDFSFPDRFKKTNFYFEKSIYASCNKENLFEYAYFLQQHKQVSDAIPYYLEVLEKYKDLAQSNPQTYLPDVANILNNLAALLHDNNEYEAAQQAYNEALEIRRNLANLNPQTYLPFVAMTAVNMSIFYLHCRQDQEMSLALAKEGIKAALPFYKELPAALKRIQKAMKVIEAWKMDKEDFLREIFIEMQINIKPEEILKFI